MCPALAGARLVSDGGWRVLRELDMIDWATGLLQEYAAMGNAGQVAFVFTILAPLGAVFALTRAMARRGYRTSAALTEDLTIARDEVANLTRDKAALARENAVLSARLPEAFIERLDAQIAQGNEDPATRDVYELLSEFAPALTAAFAHLAREEAKNVATAEDAREQAMFYRLARDNARIALALTPDHAEMAGLEEELAVATAAAEQGLTVISTDDAIRELRWKNRMDRERSVPVLMAVWNKNRDRGAYHLALFAAKEARRLASRGGAELSRDALFAAYAVANTQMFLGAYGAALSLAQSTAQQQTKAFGADDPHTLITRYLIADILLRKGEYDAALAEAEAVRTAQEAHPDIGADHPNTLTIRHLMANLLLRKGENDAALAEAQAVRSSQETHPDIGADHPHKLTTRDLIADILRSKGDYDAALTEAQVVRAAREVHPDIGADHPQALTNRYLTADILLRNGDNDAALAEAEAVRAAREAHPDIGAHHPDTLTTRHLMADLLLCKGDDDAALAEAKAVRAAREAHPDVGADHPGTLRTRLLVAEIHHARGDDSAARASLDRVKPKIEALDLAEGHTWLKAMASLEAALAEAGEQPEKG
ncbi:MAG: hypothetical protein Gyms2KO_09640 [Gymnodinialimonas sp.]